MKGSVAKDADDLFKQVLPYELYMLIFSYLSDKELVPLLQVAKNWYIIILTKQENIPTMHTIYRYDMVYDGAIWQAKYLRRWPADSQITLEPFTFRPSPASPLAVLFWNYSLCLSCV